MLTLDKGAVKKLKLPESFILGEEEYGGKGLNWRRQYVSRLGSGVEITSYYRGRPAAKVDSDAFRAVMSKPPHEIFLEGQTTEEQAEPILQEVWGALGNAGNNQITNKSEGLGGPRFHMVSCSTIDMNGRRVMVATGWFHGPDGAVHNHYCGIFFDASPNEEACRIEELIFQADSQQVYDSYLPSFREALFTMEWN